VSGGVLNSLKIVDMCEQREGAMEAINCMSRWYQSSRGHSAFSPSWQLIPAYDDWWWLACRCCSVPVLVIVDVSHIWHRSRLDPEIL